MTDVVRSDPEYEMLLANIKRCVGAARQQASVELARVEVLAYWFIGREILQRQDSVTWGNKGQMLSQLAADLRQELPDMKLSRSKLLDMRKFAEQWDDEEIVRTLLGHITWEHNRQLLNKLDDQGVREWYARMSIEQGWSSRVLVAQIETRMHERQGAALTNFSRSLPASDSELAQQMLKNPYNLEFLGLAEGIRERALEDGLIEKVCQFLLELGGLDFAFVGRQVHLEVGGQDFYIDLLLYHRRLRRLVVVDLKIDDFTPEYAGKMSFYLNAADDLLRQPGEEPSIGLILCKGQNGTVVEYALRGLDSPMGVSFYDLSRRLPVLVEAQLPSVPELTAGLDDALEGRERAIDEDTT